MKKSQRFTVRACQLGALTALPTSDLCFHYLLHREHIKAKVYPVVRASLIAQLVKNLPAMKETQVRFLDQEEPLEKG